MINVSSLQFKLAIQACSSSLQYKLAVHSARSFGRARKTGLSCCEMGKSQNQRSRHEATFLEQVKDILLHMQEEIVSIKISIEELKISLACPW